MKNYYEITQAFETTDERCIEMGLPFVVSIDNDGVVSFLLGLDQDERKLLFLTSTDELAKLSDFIEFALSDE